MTGEDIREEYLRLQQKAMEEEMSELGLGPDSLFDYGLDDGDEGGEEVFVTSEDIAKQRKKEQKAIQKGRGDVPPPDNPEDIEEELHFKRFRTNYERKYTEQEMDEIRAENVKVYVNDYSADDIYHESDEERERKNVLREIQPMLNGVRHSYSKVDQYVRAMRIVVKAWEVLEEQLNHVHTKEEFFRLVGEGRIVSSAIIMPQLRGMKKYNVERVMEYISDETLDPTRIVLETQKARNFWEEDDFEDLDEIQERVLTDEQRTYLIEHEDEPEEIEVQILPESMIKGYNTRRRSRGKPSGKKKKQQQYQKDGIHSIMRMIQNDPNNHDGSDYNRSLLLTQSLFDLDKGEADPFDDVFFTGSWTDKHAIQLNDIALREHLLQQRPLGASRTYAAMELMDFFSALEREGMNVLELRRIMNADPETMKEEDVKRTKKENKKMEAALVARITAMNKSPKFKKVVAKAEKAINEQFSE